MSAFPASQSCLPAMLADIDRAVTSGGEDRPGRVAAALQPYLGHPDLLRPEACQSCAEGYIRHLLYARPDSCYAVVALVWRPGQMSPVHAHRTWCALGVHQGVLTEAYYAPPEQDHSPRQTGSVLRCPGATSCGPADLTVIHRLANLGTAEAISIHVYGARFECFGQEVNYLF